MPDQDFDVVVIGSGFGGSVAALRLVEKGYRVAVLEAGRRFSEADFAKTNWDLRRFLWAPRLGMRGIQRITLLRNALVLSGAGVGGGSLVYANTLYEPLDHFYEDPQWAGITDWRSELAVHFDTARRMLGANEVPEDSPTDSVMRALAEKLAVPESFRRTTVGVYFGKPGETVPDPYFGGLGPERTGCIHCGGCMVGCRFGAKNTLDHNYLALAERLGAKVIAEHEVFAVTPLPGGNYEVSARRPGAPKRSRPTSFTASQVVFSAGVLGTVGLLLRLRGKGSLPALSAKLGGRVRTNSEAIVGATARGRSATNYSRGVAITSSLHPDARTQIEPVRYPKRSNAMGLLATILVDGGGRIPRQLRFLAAAATHPGRFVRSLSVRHWSERTILLLVMQSLDNSMQLVLQSNRLTSRRGDGPPNPSYIPVANHAARITAELIGGDPASAWNEVLLDVPTTAHVVGGACIAPSPEKGVVDAYHRVFGHPGLHVMDASVIPSNLGANPSLTITALAERAASFWPNKGEEDPRPPLGSPYVQCDRPIPVNPALAPDRVRSSQ